MTARPLYGPPCGTCKHLTSFRDVTWVKRCGAAPKLLLVSTTDHPITCPGHEKREDSK